MGEMQSSSRGHRLRRATVLVIAIVGIAFLLIQGVTWWKWAGMENRTKELCAEVKARPVARSVLWGEATPGNAWDEYKLALDEISTIKLNTVKLAEFIDLNPRADQAAVEAIIRTHLAAFEHLHIGAHRVEARNPNLSLAMESESVSGVLPTQALALFAACRARLLQAAGHDLEAMYILLDVCQLGRDLGENAPLISEMVAMAIYWYALNGLRDVVLTGRLGREDLGNLDHALEALDRSYPHHSFSLLINVAWRGAAFRRKGVFVSQDSFEERPLKRMEAWCYGFSPRLAAACAFDCLDSWAGRLVNSDELPWTELRRASEGIQGEVEASSNPIIKHDQDFRRRVNGRSWMLGMALPGRERRAQVRLLRVAAHFRVTGQILEVEDPFGTKIHTSSTNDKLKIWSIGRDGVDHGGSGEWKPAEGIDIVLTIAR